jgi:hypothetical protein
MARYYVSVTGLTIKSFLYYPKFMYYAIPSSMQAQNADGNVLTRTTSVNGVQHTLTVWEDKMAMRKFMVAGAHRKAMAITSEVADLEKTKVYGYESDTIPTWDEAIEIWEKHGKLHGRYTATKSKEVEVANAPSSQVARRRQALAMVVAPLVALLFLLSKTHVIGYYLMSKFAAQ